MSDIGEFIRTISDVSNPEEFEALLARIRTEGQPSVESDP